MATLPLLASANATFISDGVGGSVARVPHLGPRRYGTTWHVTHMVSTTNSVVPSQVRVYRNIESPTTIVDGSDSANQDTSETDITLGSGEFLTFVWTKGDIGAIATITVSGEMSTGRIG